MSARGWTSLLVAAVVVAAVADCGAASSRPSSAGAPPRVSSNVLRDDYAGSRACATCHASIHEAWAKSPMHRMTRSLPTDVAARFDGSKVRINADVATVETQGGARFVRTTPAAGAEQLHRVTRVIGGRYREDFVGVDVTRASNPVSDAGQGPEVVLPVSWVRSTSSWRYKGYSVLVRERPVLTVGPEWADACIGCHNTFPQLTMLLDDIVGPGAPSFQGSISDDLLPPKRQVRAKVVSDGDLIGAVTDELGVLGITHPGFRGLDTAAALRRSIPAIRDRFNGSHLVEEGVGCEACNGGARAHVEDPSILPAYGPVTPAVSFSDANGESFGRAEAINRVCARCHTVLFSRYSFTWEGGLRTDSVPGGSSINSGEARDFLLGGCAKEMSCTTCHDPHREDARADMARFDRPEKNGTCTACHEKLAEPTALRAHTHHDPTGEGSACLSCHMPRKNMGLGYELTRYHRIGSPTDEARVYGDRPLECAICHADTSTKDLLATMSSWWNKSFDTGRVERLYGGSLDGSNLRRTLEIGKPHEQAVAIGVLADRGKTSDACSLAEQVKHAYPIVRYFAKHAVEKLTKQPLDIDPGRSREELEPQIRAWCDARLR
ncbi:MAG: hypothetical protein HOV80_35295 [Polyangiaceae bacterium]|nr:hypothetical protein [Polyangiaceae bacterium]